MDIRSKLLVISGDVPQGMIKVLQKYRKILKISPGACILQGPFFLEGPKYGEKSARLILGGKLRLNIDWASL